MKPAVPVFAALFWLSLLIPCLRAADLSPGPPGKFDAPAIDAFLEAQVRRASRVGLAVAVVRNGEVVLAKGYGHASLADTRPVTPTTRFAIGSVTKQFACVCALLLAEDGKLSVHDPVAKYYPELTRAADITLLDLMHHTSGYPDYYPLDFVDRRMRQPIDPDELLRRYAGGPLDFEPRTRWSYSNTGYILLGRVVEKVSGQRFGEFLARRILTPLGMTNTIYEPAPGEAGLAQGYTTFALSPPEPVAPEGRGWLEAAGGLHSTPTDLAKWDRALMEGRLLKPASFALLTTPARLADGRMTDYGCGVSVRQQQGWQVIAHSGAVAGFNAYNAFIPATRSALILLGNVDGAMGNLPGQLLPLLLGEAPAAPTVAGTSVPETVKAVFAAYQAGEVRRGQFSPEFNHFLTDTRLAATAARLKAWGSPQSVEVTSTRERGGLEVSVTRLTFGEREPLRVLMYRRPDGIIEQFFVDAD